MDYPIIIQGVIQIVALASVMVLFKFLLANLNSNVERLERSWEKYTDRLTVSVNEVHLKLDNVHQKTENEIKDLREEISFIRSFLTDLRCLHGQESCEERG